MSELHSAISVPGRPEPTHELMARLEQALQSYENNIVYMEKELAPVLVVREPSPPEAQVMEAEYHDLHRHITHLENLNQMYESQRNRVRL